jgi:mannobiose 2-epimerase
MTDNKPLPTHHPPLSAIELQKVLGCFKAELAGELSNIIAYWQKYTPDEVHGGFWGKLANDNRVTADAPKGSVLNARILWSFSAAYNLKPDDAVLQLAHRAYEYISQYFIDAEVGGVYWLVDHKGCQPDTRKQVYASAFTIYALSEYYMASGLQAAKQQAIKLYHLLVDKSYDTVNTGYMEAFTRDWQPIGDLRLSAKDANEKKTMNTHLHVLEAYTNLYRIWPDKELRKQIQLLINNFFDHFIDVKTHHLVLFFDEDWNRKSDTVSYGHDIEATWLLLEAAQVIKDIEWEEAIKEMCGKIADATLVGLDADGGLWYEYEPFEDHLIKEKHWWVQAEAMVGFYNAWQISQDQKYLQLALKNWAFVKDKIIDHQNGEWLWGIKADGSVMPGEDKVGLWKCPYHNSRACIEIIKRITAQFGLIQIA